MLPTLLASLDLDLALERAIIETVARTPIIAMTTRSSMSVKAFLDLDINNFCIIKIDFIDISII